jgi:hypothetical protein
MSRFLCATVVPRCFRAGPAITLLSTRIASRRNGGRSSMDQGPDYFNIGTDIQYAK